MCLHSWSQVSSFCVSHLESLLGLNLFSDYRLLWCDNCRRDDSFSPWHTACVLKTGAAWSGKWREWLVQTGSGAYKSGTSQIRHQSHLGAILSALLKSSEVEADESLSRLAKWDILQMANLHCHPLLASFELLLHLLFRAMLLACLDHTCSHVRLWSASCARLLLSYFYLSMLSWFCA